MEAALTLVDETPTGTPIRTVTLQLVSERLSVAELIKARVRAEVERFNASEVDTFEGLVQPTDSEKVLNGYRLKKPRKLDVNKQCESALKAFKSNGFFMLVDDRQVENLDEELIVTPDLKVSFVKLLPLVGG